MIGTLIIAIVGYFAATFFAVASFMSVLAMRRFSLKDERSKVGEASIGFLLGVALSIGFALLTRSLTGGQF